jgi:hypothetical protein
MLLLCGIRVSKRRKKRRRRRRSQKSRLWSSQNPPKKWVKRKKKILEMARQKPIINALKKLNGDYTDHLKYPRISMMKMKKRRMMRGGEIRLSRLRRIIWYVQPKGLE